MRIQKSGMTTESPIYMSELKNQQIQRERQEFYEKAVILDRQLAQANAERLQTAEKKSFLTQRNLWASTLCFCCIAIIIFNFVFLGLVGNGTWKFDDEWLVRIVFTSSFAEVWLLARIVVTFLFKVPPRI